MTTAIDKYLQCWGSATYNRVETEREIPKLKFIYNKTKVRHLGESLLPISSVQCNIGGSISLLLARVSTFNALVASMV